MIVNGNHSSVGPWGGGDFTHCLILEPRLPGTGRPSRENRIFGSALDQRFSAQRRVEEITSLARAIDLEVIDVQICKMNAIKPAAFFSQCRIDRAKDVLEATGTGLVIANVCLTPAQQRNLERALNAKVLDRTGLILEIFGERARTREGRLQVEHAHLTYQKSRLVRSWTHLERQRGGAGFLGGPGETQLEADRRELEARIFRIERALEKVKQTRSLHRRARARVPYPVIALVGYTNAGKSTLFNALTESDVAARDQLFATLDPTMRAVDLGGGTRAILSDTVGFISDLPVELIAAFRATLEEVREADILLHVRDATDPESEAQKQAVTSVLQSLDLTGADAPPMIEVYNKVDLLDGAGDGANGSAHQPEAGNAVYVSAVTGYGLDNLRREIRRIFQSRHEIVDIDVRPEQGRALAWLHQHGDVLSERCLEDGLIRLSVSLSPRDAGRFEKEFGAPADRPQDDLFGRLG